MINLLYWLMAIAILLDGVVIGINIAEWKHRGDWR